jgi:NAD kinase
MMVKNDNPTTENKIVLVVRKTRLDELIARYNTENQAKFYIEHTGADFTDYKNEDKTYKEAVQTCQRILAQLARLQTLPRHFLPNYVFGPKDIVVAVGQDGLVANTLKYLSNQPLIGVNPDPKRWEGVLLPFTPSDLITIIPEVSAGERPIQEVTMGEARLNTQECLYAVNDFFVGPKSHTSARYRITLGTKSENQSSSGVIVSTGLGSTGWLRSVLAGATGITASLAKSPLKVTQKNPTPWDASHLYFSVREPWPSTTTQASMTFGKITAETPLRISSQMAENGVIFSDGIENDFLQFNSGTEATICLSQKKGHLIQ